MGQTRSTQQCSSPLLTNVNRYVKKSVMLNGKNLIIDSLVDDSFMAYAIKCHPLGINVTLGDLTLIISQFLVSLKGLTNFHEFVLALFTCVKDIFGKTYMQTFKKFAKKILHFFIICGFNIVDIVNMQSFTYEKAKAQTYEFTKEHISEIRNILSNWNNACDTEFGVQLKSFFALVFTSPICDKFNIAENWFGYTNMQYNAMKKDQSKKHHISWWLDTLDCTLYLVDRISECIYFGDINRILIDDEEIRTYTTNMMEILYRAEHLDLLGLRDTNFKLRDFLTEVEMTIEKAERLQSTFGKKHRMFGTLVRHVEQLKMARLKIADKMKVRSERDPPIAIVLNGPPGIGKSQLIDKFLKMLYDTCQSLGYGTTPYDSELKYTHSYSDDFDSGFSAKHEVMVVDDADQFREAIVTAQKGGAMTHIIDWINSVPYITNQAELANKGMIPFLCKYVIITTNSKDAGLKRVFNENGGAYRRLMFFDIAVKPEYCKPGTTLLAGDPTNPSNFDMHEFIPRRYIPTDGRNDEQRYCPDSDKWLTSTIPRPCSLHELAYFFKDKMIIPHYTQMSLASTANDIFQSSTFCPNCKVSEQFCSGTCTGQPVIQSWPDTDSVPDWHCDEDPILFMDSDRQDDYYTHHYDKRATFGDFLSCAWINIKYACSVPLAKRALAFDPDSEKSSYWIDQLSILESQRSSYTSSFIYYKKFYADVRQRLHTRLDTLIDIDRRRAIKNIGINLVFLAGLGATAYGIYRYVNRNAGNPPELQMSQERRDHINKQVAANKNSWKIDYADITKLSGSMATISFDQISKLVPRNIVSILYTNAQGNPCHTNAFGTHSNIAVVPRHFYDTIKDHFPINMAFIRSNVSGVCGPSRPCVKIDAENFILMNESTDMVIMRSPAFGTFRDLRNFMLSGVESGKVNGTFIKRTPKGEIEYNPFKSLTKANLRYGDSLFGTSFKYVGYNAYTERATVNGDCGGIYVVQSLNGCYIAGFHVAYRKFKGLHQTYVCPLNKLLSFPNPYIEPNSFSGIDLNSTYNTSEDLALTQSFDTKCPLRMLDSGSLIPYGGLNCHRAKLNSAVCPTIMSEDVLSHYGKLDFTHFSPREINSRLSTKINIEKMVVKTTFIPRHVRKARDALTVIYKRVISEQNISLPNKVYGVDVGINGIDGVAYCERLPVKTSGGFAHRGRKDKYFVELEPTEDHSTNNGLDSDLSDEYERMKASLIAGERPGVVWDFCHKDEPVSASKIIKNKSRVFNCAPLAFSILERCAFLWCIPMFTGKHRHLFGSAIGANSSGDDWTTLYHHVIKFGKDRIIAGDYSGFDKSMSANLMLSAFEIIISIAKEAGFPKEDIDLMVGIATECSYPLSNVFGSLAEFYGCNPSGHPLTTIINSIVNLLYIMIACMIIEEENNISIIDYEHFFDHISPLTYGDDNIMSSAHDEFNHTSISKALLSCGLTYTMADKESDSVPLSNISDVEFLKREFVPDVHKEGYVASPLNESSLIKSLSICCKSRSIAFDHQNAEIIDSACREYFQYGREIFNAKRQFLNTLLDKYSLRPFLTNLELKTYDELYLDRFGEIKLQSGELDDEEKADTEPKVKSKWYNCWQNISVGSDTPLCAFSFASELTCPLVSSCCSQQSAPHKSK